jgi:SM-20-related protein
MPMRPRSLSDAADATAGSLVLDAADTRRPAIVPRSRHEISGKQLFVFDDVFTEAFVDRFAAVLQRQRYWNRPSFDRELAAVLNGETIVALRSAGEAILGRYHAEMTAAPARQILSHALSSAVRFGDSCRLHQDDACGDCVTFLYYGNSRWDGGWGGETTFYDDEGAAVTCVSPRPGRLVLFNAALFHRGGVPNRDCPTFRYVASLFYRCERRLVPIQPPQAPSRPGR